MFAVIVRVPMPVAYVICGAFLLFKLNELRLYVAQRFNKSS
jgi:hypothetical protein